EVRDGACRVWPVHDNVNNLWSGHEHDSSQRARPKKRRPERSSQYSSYIAVASLHPHDRDASGYPDICSETTNGAGNREDRDRLEEQPGTDGAEQVTDEYGQGKTENGVGDLAAESCGAPAS